MNHTQLKLNIMTQENLDAIRYKGLKGFIDELEKHYRETREHWCKIKDCDSEYNITIDNGKLDVIEKLQSFINRIENY